jgi:ketohexokinase
MARVIAVGVATVDIVNEVAQYPVENAEVRALGHWVRRGGNATNTLVVLSQLGHRCEWAGVWTDGASGEVVRSDLSRHSVEMRYCQKISEAQMPISYITVSRASGSRTIVHCRHDVPEYRASSFANIPLDEFDWIHFEARNIPETRRMMDRVKQHKPTLPVSIEIEKPRECVESLFPNASLLLFSKAFADASGTTAESLLHSVRGMAPNANLVCSLSERGAVGLCKAGGLWYAPACLPAQVIDTVGAGDTFNAAMIDAMLRGESLVSSLRFACALAGQKCGRQGLHGLHRPA